MSRKGNYERIISTPAEVEAMHNRMFDIGRAALGDALISANTLGMLPQLANDPIVIDLSEKYSARYPAHDEFPS